MDEQLVEAWRIHNRIGLYLLDGVAEEAFAVGKRKQGRGFAQMFAHIHGVRLTWLQVSAADLWEPLPRIARGDALDRERLRRALTASGAAVAVLFERGVAAGKIKGFGGSVPAFLGYLIAHESYHFGEIGVALREAGHPLSKEIAYGMWEWTKR
ncbi:MAG: hypothetical protein H6650_11145 [Ardenticatenales bacterium]|nr:hypothetical protein [Ardenticatenales bacterium]